MIPFHRLCPFCYSVCVYACEGGDGGGVLVSCDCFNKLLQACWLQTTKVDSLTVLGGCKLESDQGHTLSGGFRGESALCLFQLLVAPGTPWLVLIPLQSLLFFLSPLRVSSTDTCHWTQGHPGQSRMISLSQFLTQLHLQRLFFLNIR